MASLKKKNEIYEILKNYNGGNPYILMLRRDVFVNNDLDVLGDFQIEYVIKNLNFKPLPINKITRLVDWYAEKKKVDWKTEFLPEKIKIVTLLGETNSTYHCYVKYRQSVDPVMCFIPKRAILKNFLVKDYKNLEVDFDRYDRLSTEKDPNRRLYEHQKEAVKFLLARKKCILADDQGLGKTTSLSVAAIEGNFDSVVVICPASLKTNWAKELFWYCNEKDVSVIESFNDKRKDELEGLLGYSIGKSGKKKEELLLEAKERGKWEDNRFVIVNYDILDEFYKIPKSRSKESLSDAFAQSPLLRYINNRKSLIVIDEAHRLSNSTANTYKIVKDLIKRGNPDSIYLSTGTPITNNPQNLYCLLQLLDDSVAEDYDYYMKRYCGAIEIVAPKDKEKRNLISDAYVAQKGKTTWFALTDEEKKELDERIRKNCRMMTIAKDATHLDELKERISHIYMRRIKEELGTIPEKIYHDLRYELTYEQRQEYSRLWDEYEEAKKNEEPEKELNRELLEGSIYRKYLADQMVEHTIKFVNGLISKGEKVVIACCYDTELYSLRDYYGNKCVIYNGKITAKQKDAAIERFYNDPECMVFIGNNVSASVGITLINSCNLVWNSFSYSSVDVKQFQDRICRIGQKRKCHIWFQMFSDTQNEHVWDIVLKKELISNTVIKTEKEK